MADISLSEALILAEHQRQAAERLAAARRMCDAVANQPYTVQAEAARDLLCAEAVCAEWCVSKRQVDITTHANHEMGDL